MKLIQLPEKAWSSIQNCLIEAGKQNIRLFIFYDEADHLWAKTDESRQAQS